MNLTRRLFALSAAAVLALGVAPPANAASRVGTAGRALTLDGRPWWPTGFDAYELGTNWSLNKGCGAQVDLNAYFSSLPPDSLTRFNAYSSMGVAALDAVFAAARRHSQLLVAVLASGEGACEGEVFKDEQWYATGWTGPYADWLDTAVSRWGASPALAGWELVGEPEPSNCGDAACSWQRRSCPPDASATLRTFFDEAGARLRALDSDTPIWEGIAGGSQCGVSGDGYVAIGQSPFIDVLDLHDYGSTDVDLRLRQAKAIGKPLVVAEMGRFAGSCESIADRAVAMAARAAAQKQAGTAGALFWNFVPDPRSDQCTMDIGPKDPLFGVLESLSD